MIRVFLLLLCSSFFCSADAQLLVKPSWYGLELNKSQVNDWLRIPSDTTNNKSGIARIGTTLYAGNGTYWTAASGGGSTTLYQAYLNGSLFSSDANADYGNNNKQDSNINLYKLVASEVRVKSPYGVMLNDNGTDNYGSFQLSSNDYVFQNTVNSNLYFHWAQDGQNSRFVFPDTSAIQYYNFPKVDSPRYLVTQVGGVYADEWGNVPSSGGSPDSSVFSTVTRLSDSIDVVQGEVGTLRSELQGWGIEAALNANPYTTVGQVIEAGNNDFSIQTTGIGSLGDHRGLINGAEVYVDVPSNTANMNGGNVFLGNGEFQLINKNNGQVYFNVKKTVNKRIDLFINNPETSQEAVQITADTTDNADLLLLYTPNTGVPFYYVSSSDINNTKYSFTDMAGNPQVEYYGAADEPCAEFKRRVEIDSTVKASGVILPTYPSIDLSGGDYTATTSGIYEVNITSVDYAFILPDPTALNGQTITIANPSGDTVNVIGGTFVSSIPDQSMAIFSAINGLWYGK